VTEIGVVYNVTNRNYLNCDWNRHCLHCNWNTLFGLWLKQISLDCDTTDTVCLVTERDIIYIVTELDIIVIEIYYFHCNWNGHYLRCDWNKHDLNCDWKDIVWIWLNWTLDCDQNLVCIVTETGNIWVVTKQTLFGMWLKQVFFHSERNGHHLNCDCKRHYWGSDNEPIMNFFSEPRSNTLFESEFFTTGVKWVESGG